jgi:hypothetical protein
MCHHIHPVHVLKKKKEMDFSQQKKGVFCW